MMLNYSYNRPRIASLCYHAFSPHIFGFLNLFDLLRWYMDPRRSSGSMSCEFLPKDVKEIYYRAEPIIIYRRDKITKSRFEKIFNDFQKKREDFENAKIPEFLDIVPTEVPEIFRNIFDFIEKRNTEKFMNENLHLKYFAICNVREVIVNKTENQEFHNEKHELDDVINHIDNENISCQENIVFQTKNLKEDKSNDNNIKCFMSNNIDLDWERIDDNPYYNWDIDMDQQSPEFWDSL